MNSVATAAQISVSAKSLGVALACGVLLSVPAHAQEAPPPTGQTRGELETPEVEDRRTNSITTEFRRDGGARQSCPFEENGTRVSINQLQFVDGRPVSAGGTGALAPELVETLASVPQPSGEYSLTAICDLRDAANDALRRDGWIATVQVPPQELEGTLTLNVISARLTEIRITGETGPYRDLLQDLLAPLTQLDPLNERDAERILLNANDVPGLDVRLALAPAGEGGGAVVGNLSANYERFAAYVNARNYNASSIGRETVFGRVEYYGLTGMSDITHIAAQTTIDFNEQFIFEVGHEFGVGSENIRIGTSAVYASARPDIQDLDLQTDTFLANIEASYPYLRTPLTAVDISFGLDWIEQETSVGPVPISKDALRTFYIRGDIQGQKRRPNRDPLFAYSGYLEVRQGVSFLGATDFGDFGTSQTGDVTASRPFGYADATVMRAAADVTWFPVRGFDIRGRVEGQITNRPLLNFDEFAIGNLSIGRGYDPGANSGDRAIGGVAEATATLFDKAQHRLKLFGFFDIVQLENLDRGTPDPRRTLKSVGGGLRYNFGRKINAEVIFAEPLDRPLFFDNEDPPSRILFSITTKFPALVR